MATSQSRARTRAPHYLYLLGKTIPADGSGDRYEMIEIIGISSYSNVYKAVYLPEDREEETQQRTLKLKEKVELEYVSVKALPHEIFRQESEILGQEIRRSVSSYTPGAGNIIEIMKPFHLYGKLTCVSMPYMSEGSLRHIISKHFTGGLPEDCIAVALRETLKGLCYLHARSLMHKKLDAGQIFVNRADSNEIEIKLGFEASIYEHGEQRMNPDVTGSTSALPLGKITEWGAAPEIYQEEEETRYSYKSKSDIWLVGIIALELAYGSFPVCDRDEFDAVIEEITKKKRLPTLEKLKQIAYKEKVKGKGKKVLKFLEGNLKSLVEKGKKMKDKVKKSEEKQPFSPEFEEVVAKCLKAKREKRPTAGQLLQFEFFRRSKDLKYFERVVLNGQREGDDSGN